MTESTPKVNGYLADTTNKIVLWYRKNRKVYYFFQINYSNREEEIILGAKFYGRISSDRCDISPDGRYFVYFAMGMSTTTGKPERSCWTAVCQPPKITADVFLEQPDTWGTGGRFVDDRTVYVSYGAAPQYDTTKDMYFKDLRITFQPPLADEDGISHGWSSADGPDTAALVWQKERWGIFLRRKYRRYNPGKTGSFDAFQYTLWVVDRKIELEFEGIAVQWADFDNLDRLVCGHGPFIVFYSELKEVLEKNPMRIINLEDYIKEK
ncbi:MAG: hypothetical protein KDC53_14975 [Saprospiraceae bacterium]|nr:hypothetical protein [Saprospiraceae bacterium]